MVCVRRVLWAPRPAELVDLREVSTPRTVDPLKRRFGVRGSVAVRRLANPVTVCDGHGVFFVAASGQIRMAASPKYSWRSCVELVESRKSALWPGRMGLLRPYPDHRRDSRSTRTPRAPEQEAKIHNADPEGQLTSRANDQG